MDNKFVHIDKLFKDGLSGGEEQMPSGSWLRMQELLDKEMPRGAAVPVAPSRFRNRYWMPALLLLLVGGGTAGSWYYFNSDQATGSAPGKMATTQVAATPSPLQQRAGNIDALTATKGESENVTGAESEDVQATGSERSAGYNANGTASGKGLNSSETAPHNTRSNSFAALSGGANTLPGGKHAANTGKPVQDIAGAGAKMQAASKSSATDDAQPTAKQHTAVNEASARGQEILLAMTGGLPVPTAFKPVEIETAQRQLSYLADNGSLVVVDDRLVKKSEKEVTRMSINETPVYKENAGRFDRPIGVKLDTTAIVKYKETFYEKLSPLEMAALSKMDVRVAARHITPLAASAKIGLTERGVQLLALSDFKVKSRKTTPEKINEVIRETTSGVSALFDGTKKYYAALMIGGNGTFGNSPAYGIQAGIAGFYTLSERWTLGAELKLFNRNFDYNMQDKSLRFNPGTPTMSGSEFLYEYTGVSSTINYKVQNFTSIEMPVYLNYNLGRVSLFGGANLACGFTMNPNRSTDVQNLSGTERTTTKKFPLQDQAAAVAATDFRSRFGLGYLVGLNYDLSRNLSLDARMTQNIWDNASGTVSRQISSTVFRQPSFQLGLNFFFGRREKVIYILER